MPQTLTEVRKILHVLEDLRICPVTLLVVSGLDWSERELCMLRSLQNAGYELAGHGWYHQCCPPETFKHKVHSAVISRNTAEHLSLKPVQIIDVIQRCFQWFQDVGLQLPNLYVPPAWAIGQIPRNTLKALPFRIYECLTGIYDIRTGHSFRLPLVGYMADTRLRIWLLRILNYINRRFSVSFGLPLRIAIHPYDLQLGLVSDLKTLLKQYTCFLSYPDIM